MHAAVFERWTRTTQQANIEGAGTKWDGRREERRKVEEEESAVYDRICYRQRLGKVGVEDEDKELMDEGNNVRYLRMNWIDDMTECQVQSRIICYQGSSAEMIRNPKEQYHMSLRGTCNSRV
jgi:hypothetical protein